MSTKMECLTCNGQGWVEDFYSEPTCCGGSEWECGAAGCTGPVEQTVQTQVGCDDCQGTGFATPDVQKQENKK